MVYWCKECRERDEGMIDSLPRDLAAKVLDYFKEELGEYEPLDGDVKKDAEMTIKQQLDI